MDAHYHSCLSRFREFLQVIVCGASLCCIFFSSLAQPVHPPVNDASFELKSIQLLDGDRLKLSWFNEGALGYELYHREHLDQGNWIKMVDLTPTRESIQTFELSLDGKIPSTFFSIQKIPNPLASLLTLELGEGISMEFVSIPSGTFTMGSPQTETHRENDEGPLTKVTLSKHFLLGKYEVTQAQWKAVMEHNPSRFKGDHLPVERVSWNLARAFCERLTELESQSGRLPEGYAFTLPTEAQREYACRAGTQTRFYYGEDPGYSHLGEYAWYWTNSGSKTHPVGAKEPNEWGLYDMHGNVWEWCLDVYANAYPGGNVINPLGPESGAVRVIRGGGWEDFARDCRSACRLRAWPGNSFSYLGFRVALSSIQGKGSE